MKVKATRAERLLLARSIADLSLTDCQEGLVLDAISEPAGYMSFCKGVMWALGDPGVEPEIDVDALRIIVGKAILAKERVR